MAASLSIIAWRTLFSSLGCFMLATLVYTILADGSPFRRDVFTPWFTTTLLDFNFNVVAIAVLVAYKESNWLSRTFWVILVFLGSIGTCAYIVRQLFSIQAQDSSQDPMHLVLLRKDGECKVICRCIVLGRIAFSVLGVTMSVILGYTLVTDGSPFRKELLTLWMNAILIDFYINVFAISVWVWHKESSWINAIFWTSMLICLGRWLRLLCCTCLDCKLLFPQFSPLLASVKTLRIATCAYIVIQLFKLSCKDPRYNVLIDSHSKYGKDTSSQ